MISRRNFFGAAIGFPVAAVCILRNLFGSSDFWNKQQPSAWSSAEVLQLATNSPWARVVRGDIKPVRGRGRTAAAGPAGGSTDVVVRWESAAPIVEALKYHMPADFDGHYVIALGNLPLERGFSGQPSSPEDFLDQLKSAARLQAKGKEPAAAGVVQRKADGTILVGFSREFLPLSTKDKEVTFLLDSEQVALKAVFHPPEMIYRGALAL